MHICFEPTGQFIQRKKVLKKLGGYQFLIFLRLTLFIATNSLIHGGFLIWSFFSHGSAIKPRLNFTRIIKQKRSHHRLGKWRIKSWNPIAVEIRGWSIIYFPVSLPQFHADSPTSSSTCSNPLFFLLSTAAIIVTKFPFQLSTHLLT